MIGRKILPLAAAIPALTASIGVVLVAVFFALYSLLRGVLEPAQATGCIVLGVAVLLLAVGCVALVIARGGRRNAAAEHHPPSVSRDPNATPLERLTDFIRDRPLLAAGGVAATGLIALRNPAIVLGLTRLAFAAFQGPPPRRR